ncbi:MAG: hypothetical protein AMXMBFR58_23360 [Phycisphaerae bacterium]
MPSKRPANRSVKTATATSRSVGVRAAKAPARRPRAAPRATAAAAPSAHEQWEGFLAKFDPPVAAVGRAAVKRLRGLFPTANVVVYDNYNALVAGFVPGDRPSEAIVSIAVYPRYASLCFLQGSGLPDPHQRLKAFGKLVKFLRLEPETGGVKRLDDPQIRDLLELAAASAKVPFASSGKGAFTIRSISAKQRPRRAG